MNDALVVVFPGQVFDARLLDATLSAHPDHPLVQRLATFLGHEPGWAGWATIDATDPALAGPCTLVAGLVAADVHVDRARVAAIAGHSFGEITAITYAGGLDVDGALDIVAARGRLSGQIGRTRPGSMIAVMGLAFHELEWIRRGAVARAGGVCELAAVNDRTQFVLTGDAATIAEAGVRLAAAEAVVAPLAIPGSFHSPIMAAALEEFAAVVSAAEPRTLEVPLYSNVDAAVHTEAADVEGLITRGLVMPVLWRDVVVALAADGFTTVVEAGPGETLTKLGRRGRLLRFIGLDEAGPRPVLALVGR